MRVAQWSLQYAVDPDFMERTLRAYEEQCQALVWGHTEVGRFDNNATRARVFAPTGWSHIRGNNATDPGSDETLIRWQTEAISYFQGNWAKLSDLTYNHDKAHGGKPYDPFHATWVLLRDKKTGSRELFIELHAPTRSTLRRQKVWDDVMGGKDGVVNLGHTLRNRYPDAGLTLLMDANAGWRTAATRKLLTDHVAVPLGLTFSWDVAMPKTGGGNLISHIASTRPVSNPKVWPMAGGGLDHALITADLDTTVKAPTRVGPPMPRPGNAKAPWQAHWGAPVAHPWSGAYDVRWRRRHPLQWKRLSEWRASYLRKLRLAGQ